MKKKIFCALFFAVLGVQLVSILSVAFVLDGLIIKQNFKNLETTLWSINQDFLQKILAENQAILMPYRMSVIAVNGDVLYENKAQIQNMENHLTRKEVQEALTLLEKNMLEKSVFTQRKSKTLGVQTLYATRVMQVGSTPLIVRLSEDKKTLQSFLLDLLPYVCALFIFALCLSVVLAYILALRIIAPIEKIDLSKPMKTNPYKELQVFMQRIAKQKKKIKKQISIIKARKREMEMIIHNAKEGFLLLNADGSLRSYNAIALEYLQINPTDSLLNLPHLNALKVALESLIANGGAQDYQLECPVKERTFHCLMLPIWLKNKLDSIALVVVDKSAQKQAEDLRKAFSANVTHELKTPLSVILASSEMLKNHLVKKDDEEMFLERIYAESKRLSLLIDKILQLSFFDENQNVFELEKQPVVVSEIFKRVQKNLQSLAKEKDITIVLQTQECEILGISALLEDMVYNLVENAIKYSNRGSEVRLLAQEDKGRVVICVQDEGVGIPLQEQERVFERFYCVDKSRSKKLGGSGLGLSIVKNIARIHNATIHIKSKLGEGTEIRIEFISL